MSFIDGLYKEEAEEIQPQSELEETDYQVIESIVDSVKKEIKKRKKERNIDGYVFREVLSDQDSKMFKIGIDDMSKVKYKRYSENEVLENRVPTYQKKDRLDKRIDTVLPFNDEYFFYDFNKQFLSQLEKKLYELGLKEVALTVEKTPVEFVVLSPFLWKKDTYKATYYNNNRKKDALKIQLQW